MPERIFINYRRDDVPAEAARLRDRLASKLGEGNVFMDVNNLLPGQRFDVELAKALAQTDVFLAVIGSRWIDVLKERLRGGDRDYVREEISSALARGILIIPILINGTALPRAAALPEDIRDFVMHEEHDVTHKRFGRDVDDLLAAIKTVRRRNGTKDENSRSARWVLPAGLAALVLVIGFSVYVGGNEQHLAVPPSDNQRSVPAPTTPSPSPGQTDKASSPGALSPSPPMPPPPRSRPVPKSLVEVLSESKWAVGSEENCDVPQKSYSLSSDGDKITWRSGNGNIDIEAIRSSSTTELRTTTVESDHRIGGGESRGQKWIYSNLDTDNIKVQPDGRKFFMLVRCP